MVGDPGTAELGGSLMLSEGHVRNFGLRVGRVLGIEVWFHWAFLIIVVVRPDSAISFQFDISPIIARCACFEPIIQPGLLSEQCSDPIKSANHADPHFTEGTFDSRYHGRLIR